MYQLRLQVGFFLPSGSLGDPGRDRRYGVPNDVGFNALGITSLFDSANPPAGLTTSSPAKCQGRAAHRFACLASQPPPRTRVSRPAEVARAIIATGQSPAMVGGAAMTRLRARTQRSPSSSEWLIGSSPSSGTIGVQNGRALTQAFLSEGERSSTESTTSREERPTPRAGIARHGATEARWERRLLHLETTRQDDSNRSAKRAP